MKNISPCLILVFLFSSLVSLSQEKDSVTVFTEETFNATILVIGQSVENPLNGDLVFNVQHRFGAVNTGWYDFFGLDKANTRLGFQYGITDWLAIGIGRSSYEKTYDGWVKVKILRQSTGKRKIPLSIDYFGSIGISALKWSEPERENYFSSRMSYANLLLIARKFSPGVSIQIMPAHVHYNLVETKEDDNDVFSIGAGGKFNVSKRISINLEYFYIISKQTRKQYKDPFSIGIDIKTSGHVFQLYASNAEGLIEQHFIGRTTGNWLNGDIHIGFNISRSFTLKAKDYWD